MSNFLEVDESLFARNLIVNPEAGAGGSGGSGDFQGSGGGPSPTINFLTPSERQEQTQCKFIIPHPGLCIKTREIITNHKIFINLCKSDDVYEPDEYFTDEELGKILSDGADDEVTNIKIPMSIGEKHIEKDNSGTMCPVFEVIINTTFFEKKILTSEIYRTFLIVIIIEGLEEKFKMELDKNGYLILQNKKCLGKLNPQLIKAKPRIKEIKPMKASGDGLDPTLTGSKPVVKKMVEEIDTKELNIDCNITQFSRDLAKAEIKLPNLKNTKKLLVTLGADRIIVDSPVGQLDIFVPLDIHQEESKAEFDVNTSTLNLHLPLIVKP